MDSVFFFFLSYYCEISLKVEFVSVSNSGSCTVVLVCFLESDRGLVICE